MKQFTMCYFILFLTISCNQDPREPIVKKGYQVNIEGFRTCIENDDTECVDLFLKADLDLGMDSGDYDHNPLVRILAKSRLKILKKIITSRMNGKRKLNFNVAEYDRSSSLVRTLLFTNFRDELASEGQEILILLGEAKLSREELDLTINMSCNTPFGKMHNGNALVGLMQDHYDEDQILLRLRPLAESYSFDIHDCEGNSLLSIAKTRGLVRVVNILEENLKKFKSH